MVCVCPCHNSRGSIKHVIPCCIPNLRLTEDILKQIAEQSVVDVLDKVKQDQLNLQDKTAKKIDSSTPKGDGKEKLGKEADSDPLNTGAPKRAPGSLPGADQQQNPAPQQQKQSPLPQPEQVDADSIIDKFNIIRSGRSLNDKDVKEGVKNYFMSLTPQQRLAVFSVLQQIASIVQPAVDSSRLQAPEEPKGDQTARLNMLHAKQSSMTNAPQQPTSQPVAAPAPPAAPQQSKPAAQSEEDRTPPVRVKRKSA